MADLSLSFEFLLGATEDIAVSGNMLYATFGDETWQYNISNPASPQLLNRYKHDGIKATHSAHSGRFMGANSKCFVVSNYSEGVKIIDISSGNLLNLTYPVPVNSIYVLGNTLLIATSAGIHVVDITIPLSPFEVRTIPVYSEAAYTNGSSIVSINGRTINVYEMTGSLRWSSTFVENRGIPACSVWLHYLAINMDVDFMGNFIIVGNEEGVFYVFDKNTGAILTQYPSAYRCTGTRVTVQNDRVIAAFHDSIIDVVQISADGRTATKISSFDYGLHVGGYPRNVRAFTIDSVNYCALAAEYRGFGIIRVDNPPTLSFKSSGYGSITAVTLTSDGKISYAVDDFAVRAIDNNTGTQVGILETGSRSGEQLILDSSRNVLYDPAFQAGIISVDVSNPSNLRKLGQLVDPIYNYANTVQFVPNNTAQLIAALGNGATNIISIIDVSNPSDMVKLRSTGTFGRTVSYIQASGNYAFVGGDTNTLNHVIWVVDITRMVIINQITVPYQIRDLLLVGNFLYVSIYTVGLLPINVSNPANPVIGTIFNEFNGGYHTSKGLANMGNNNILAGMGTGAISDHLIRLDTSVWPPRIVQDISIPGADIYSIDVKNNVAVASMYSFGIKGYTLGAQDILSYYRGLGNDPNVVETTDLLNAADDWSNNRIVDGFTSPITTQQLLELADEWSLGQ